MPVRTQPTYGIVCLLVILAVICFTVNVDAQTLVGGSLFSSASDASQNSNKVWFQYQNSFEFKKGMYIDSDFGHIFHTNTTNKRLNVRSVFKYALTENLKIGTGMGFFWDYDQPTLMQELRFIQEVNYFKDFGNSIMSHDLRLEEQIQQSIESDDKFDTRLRYRFGLSFPTNSPLYVGIYDEIFKVLSGNTSSPFFSMNRAGVMLGYRTYRYLSLEAHLMMEDRYSKQPGETSRSLILQVAAKHVL